MSSISFIVSCSGVDTIVPQKFNFFQSVILQNKSALKLHLIFDSQWQSDLKEDPFTALYSGVKGSEHSLPSVTAQDYQKYLT